MDSGLAASRRPGMAVVGFRFECQRAKRVSARIPAAHFASEFCKEQRPQQEEGAGNTGCFSHTHGLVCNKESTRVVHHRFSRCPGVPCAMVLTLMFVLSPVSVTS